MSDLISRQAAILWVKTECNPYGKPTIDFESGKKVIKHLEQMQSAHPERRWIPCSERLPELDQEVLVYAIGKDDGFIGDAVTTISERFIFRLFPSSDGVEEWRSPWEYFDSNYEITHWMPLPEPPKGEEE